MMRTTKNTHTSEITFTLRELLAELNLLPGHPHTLVAARLELISEAYQDALDEDWALSVTTQSSSDTKTLADGDGLN